VYLELNCSAVLWNFGPVHRNNRDRASGNIFIEGGQHALRFPL
jgi:hypothetical protein